jgi:Caspase domain
VLAGAISLILAPKLLVAVLALEASAKDSTIFAVWRIYRRASFTAGFSIFDMRDISDEFEKRQLPKARLASWSHAAKVGHIVALRYDAEDFAAFIETPQGGSFQQSNVHVVTNSAATREQLYAEFDWLYSTAESNDLVYVFFAGHGIEYRNTSYFLPYDASKGHRDAFGIPMPELFHKVTDYLSVKQVIVFIDACHAAGAAEGARSPLSIDIQKQWNTLNDKEGQISMALFSSLAYQKSWEDADFLHGLFTWYLLEGLKLTPGRPRILQLFTYVVRRV